MYLFINYKKNLFYLIIIHMYHVILSNLSKIHLLYLNFLLSKFYELLLLLFYSSLYDLVNLEPSFHYQRLKLKLPHLIKVSKDYEVLHVLLLLFAFVHQKYENLLFQHFYQILYYYLELIQYFEVFNCLI